MIIFDQTIDEAYEPIDCSFSIPTTHPYANIEMQITLPLKMYPYVQYWGNSMYDKTGLCYPASKYKRELFFLGKVDLFFDGAWIKDINMTDNNIRITLSSDFFTGGDFNEIKSKLKQSFRDKKIDELLL